MLGGPGVLVRKCRSRCASGAQVCLRSSDVLEGTQVCLKGVGVWVQVCLRGVCVYGHGIGQFVCWYKWVHVNGWFCSCVRSDVMYMVLVRCVCLLVSVIVCVFGCRCAGLGVVDECRVCPIVLE